MTTTEHAGGPSRALLDIRDFCAFLVEKGEERATLAIALLTLGGEGLTRLSGPIEAASTLRKFADAIQAGEVLADPQNIKRH